MEGVGEHVEEQRSTVSGRKVTASLDPPLLCVLHRELHRSCSTRRAGLRGRSPCWLAASSRLNPVRRKALVCGVGVVGFFLIVASSSASGDRAAVTCNDASGLTVGIRPAAFGCYVHKDFRLSGRRYRIFMPTNFSPLADAFRSISGRSPAFTREDIAETTQEAIQETVSAYQGLGPGRFALDLYITPFLNKYESGRLADTNSRNPCRAFVRAPAVALGQVWVAGYQQVVAHELFHCFQYENLFAQMSVDRPVRSWWVEGSAEYFSNVAFPAVNLEYTRLPTLDAKSLTTSVLDFTKGQNFLFFQYLANETGGPAAVFRLLQRMPTRGSVSSPLEARADQQDALAGLPLIDKRFHNYGEQYLDRSIRDADGAVHLSGHAMAPDAKQIRRSMDLTLDAAPFVVRRFRIVFAANRRYTLTTTVAGSRGLSSAKLTKNVGQPGRWDALPRSIPCRTDATDYTVLVTNTTSSRGSQQHSLKVQVQSRPCSFRIRNVTYQRVVRAKGREAVAGPPLRISWEGSPVFPVTVWLEPICPGWPNQGAHPLAYCVARTFRVEESSNPIVPLGTGVHQYCISHSGGHYSAFIHMNDSAREKTNTVRISWSCPRA